MYYFPNDQHLIGVTGHFDEGGKAYAYDFQIALPLEMLSDFDIEAYLQPQVNDLIERCRWLVRSIQGPSYRFMGG